MHTPYTFPLQHTRHTKHAHTTQQIPHVHIPRAHMCSHMYHTPQTLYLGRCSEQVSSARRPGTLVPVAHHVFLFLRPGMAGHLERLSREENGKVALSCSCGTTWGGIYEPKAALNSLLRQPLNVCGADEFVGKKIVKLYGVSIFRVLNLPVHLLV